MFRKYLLAAGAVGISLGGVALAATGATAAPRGAAAVTFKGTITCKLAGGITATPPLTNTAQTVKFKLVGHPYGCKGSTSQGGATITGGKIRGTVTVSGATCSGLLSSPPALKGAIDWTTTGSSATPTGFTLSGGMVTSGNPLTIAYTSTQTGSFAGSGNLTAAFSQSPSTLLSDCAGSGIPKLTLTQGSSVS